MNELDLLKKDWKKRTDNYPVVSQEVIYNMIQKKSSSLVKMIFAFSIAEIVFWILFDLLSTSDEASLKKYHIYEFVTIFNYFNYAVIVLFIYVFYKNYKKINTMSNVKELMKSILRVKKNVNYYILYNLSVLAITFGIVFYQASIYDTYISDQLNQNNPNYMIGFYISFIITFTILFGFVYFIYQMIYGRLIKKLLRNYKELEKIEI